MAEQETLLEFPCAFPLKIMGETHEAFQSVVIDIVSKHAPDFDSTTLEVRASSGGKYVSLTCTVTATSKPQLDALYMELTGHPLVKVVL
jgi:uncharacterized protein